MLRRTQTPAGIRNGLVVQLVRTLACHARGRGFEPHPGRQLYSTAHAGMAQSVEHILGKDEVTSSILVTSSKGIARSQDTVDGHFGFFGTFFRPHPFSQFSVKGCGLFMKQKITFREQLKRDLILSLHSMTDTTQNCCKYAHEATCNSSNLFFRHIFFLTNPLMCCIIKKEI